MIFGAILAGGTGQRMGNDSLPKQFLELGDKPILIHTLEKFLTCAEFDGLYVGVHGDWIVYLQDLIQKHLPQEADRVTICGGGADRNETLFRVIDRIEADHGVSEEHIIVTHDAVRPFVTLRMIEENIELAKKYGAVDTVVPAVDTIVASEDGQTITQIPNRSTMFQGQTPQSFRISLLKELYLSLSEEEKAQMTDACRICVIRNVPVYLAAGSDTNLKITTPGDLKIAQAMVKGALLD